MFLAESFGFVEFECPSDAERAMEEMNNMLFEGAHLIVRVF